MIKLRMSEKEPDDQNAGLEANTPYGITFFQFQLAPNSEQVQLESLLTEAVDQRRSQVWI